MVMFVVIVAMGYPTEDYPLHGLFEFDQARALARMGHKVILAAVDVRSLRRWRHWGLQREYKKDVEVYCINIPLGRVPGAMLNGASVWGLGYLYRKILQDHGKPDVVHAHFFRMGYVAAKAKGMMDTPLVITEHSSLIVEQRIEPDLYERALFAYRNADSLIAVSPALANRIQELFCIAPTYIPNMVATDVFSYTNREALSKTAFKLLAVGLLIPRKRMDILIEAFHIAFYSTHNVTLTICGEGPERSRLTDLIRRRGLASKVILMGRCTREEVAKQLSDSDCFALPSASETFGVVYIEALAMGVPVIATRCGGPEGFVNEGNGVLVPVDDISALAQALRDMYSNIGRYDRAAIADETRALFAPESVASRLTAVYSRVSSKGR
jgi:glycosyltransferase involved in cell wall biosynthesis